MNTEDLAYPLPAFLRLAGISRSQAYREINAGKLKAKKLGTRTVILASDAQAFLDNLPAYEPRKAA
ncbi:DNA-binding protein [Devosia sp. CN2-171]|uniref:DNA-binding protein n=1 Tax=Devosia sp. CN2-171 TaxID=3400909 RepID=UPI003BF81A3F